MVTLGLKVGTSTSVSDTSSACRENGLVGPDFTVVHVEVRREVDTRQLGTVLLVWPWLNERITLSFQNFLSSITEADSLTASSGAVISQQFFLFSLSSYGLRNIKVLELRKFGKIDPLVCTDSPRTAGLLSRRWSLSPPVCPSPAYPRPGGGRSS